MQRTKHGQNGASPLILVLSGLERAMPVRRRVVGATAIFAALLGYAAADPCPFGPLGYRLTSEDLAAIYERLGQGSVEPLALFGWRSQVLPEVWYVDAFMSPMPGGPQLRRGRLVHFQCSPVQDDRCSNWTMQEDEGQYIQVLDLPAPAAEAAAVRSVTERPIRLKGTLSDKDLISLVAFIRTGPTPPVNKDGSEPMSVRRLFPILDIAEQPDGTVRVVLSPDGGVGETVVVRREKRAWRVQRVTGWVI